MTNNCKLLLVEDHTFYAKGVEASLPKNAGLQVVGHCTNLKDALNSIQHLQPHIVLLDVRLGSENGLDLVELCRAKGLKTKFIVLSADERYTLHATAANIGIAAVLPKMIMLDQLLNTIIAVHLNKYVRPEAGDKALVKFLQEETLTERQIEVCELLMDGNSKNEIARILGRSPHTVDSQIRTIYAKLEIKTREELLLLKIPSNRKVDS